MRTFIGVDFTKETKDGIAKVQSLVREHAQKGRFKYIGNFHLTLKFLGEIPHDKTIEISRALKACAANHQRFSLNIDQIGYFNGRVSIHALWLGLAGDTAQLHGLNQDIEESMSRLGFKKEKKTFTPHITIAQDLILKTPFEELKNLVKLDTIKPIEVKEIQFIKSEEINGKRIYTPISVFPLR